MKNKKIKQLVNKAFQNETPNILIDIKSKCQCLPQADNIEAVCEQKRKINLNIFFKRLVLCSLLVVIFLVGFFIGNLDKVAVVNAKEASVYLDVNPSIEIQVDNNNFILDCIPINEDGEKILDGITLTGVNLNTALCAILGSMYANGYLDVDTNSILVSVDSEKESNLLVDIIDHINNFFKDNEEMKCSIIAQNIVKNKDLEDKALKYKSSIGKMSLVEKIVMKNDYFTEENLDELVEMSIHELDLLYHSISSENKEDEYIIGSPGGYIENDKVYNYVIEILEIDEENVEYYDIATLYHYEDPHSHKMIYVVTLMIKGQDSTQNYIIDCKNGEFLSEKVIDKWEDKLENGPKHKGNDDKEEVHSHKNN